jgi:hypothetical protein
MKKVSTNTRLHISSDMRHAYHTKTYDFLHIMTRPNPFGRGRKYEIINVLVDTFYLICNMPILSDFRIFHWLTHPTFGGSQKWMGISSYLTSQHALRSITLRCVLRLSGHMMLSVHCTLHHVHW